VDTALLKASPRDVDARILQGQILIKQGKPQDAAHVLEVVTTDDPNNPVAHYELGVAYAANSNIVQAQTEWKTANKLRPGMPDVQKALAGLAEQQQDYTALAASGSQLIKTEPRAADGYLFHAAALLHQGDQTGAEADLKSAMQEAPKDSRAFTAMGDLRAAQKRPDEAEKFYTLALSMDPSSAEALTGLVNLDVQQKQPSKALALVQNQISRVPPNSKFYLVLGQVELRNQAPDKAEAAFEKATQLDPNNVPAFMFLATVQASQGSVDQAVAGYKRAIQSNPKDVRLYVALGSLLEIQGSWQEAESTYQQALQVKPNYPVAANNLAYLMLEHGADTGVALSLAQTARRGLPDLPASADTLGWAYYK
ncbi:MAG: tetratricopeptide repeat protein, partial [Candidatus Angelobacter sp.]